MNGIEQNVASTQSPDGIWPILFIALMITLSLSGIADHDLWTPDEPREAAIALSMSQSGHYVIPELAGQPFVEKPPLFYIIASFSLHIFGRLAGNTAALRLVSAFFGLFTLLFTYLLGKTFFDRQKALFAAGILATMFGFVHVTHWLLVDNALMFFIIASIWALAQSYADPSKKRDNCPAFLIPAGFFAACAFLAKGFIGPMIIAIAWAGLFLPQIKKSGWNKILSKKSIIFHCIGLITALLIASGWIVLFYLQGGPELFREWWWTNHFGRFSGQATNLGHISPWYYYFGVLPVYILPWLVPFIAALGILLNKIRRKEPLSAGIFLLSFWIIGTLLLFSLSATKREIYLGAFLPACALFCVSGLKDRTVGLEKTIYTLWLAVLFALTAAGIMAPFFAHYLPQIPLFSCGWRQALAAAVFIAAIIILRDNQTLFFKRFLTVTLMLSATVLTIYCPMIDGFKSYGPAFRSAASAVKQHPQLTVAGYQLDETTVAGFYYYGGLVFPATPDQKILTAILQGRDKTFNGVFILKKNVDAKYLPDNANQVIFEGRMGKRRLLQLLAAPDWDKKGRRQ